MKNTVLELINHTLGIIVSWSIYFLFHPHILICVGISYIIGVIIIFTNPSQKFLNLIKGI